MPIRDELFALGESPPISCEKTYHKDDMARKRLHLSLLRGKELTQNENAR